MLICAAAWRCGGRTLPRLVLDGGQCPPFRRFIERDGGRSAQQSQLNSFLVSGRPQMALAFGVAVLGRVAVVVQRQVSILTSS
jgi:hypothetical protein